MNYPILKVKKLYLDAQLPVRANPTDSGADVFVHHFERSFTRMGSDSISPVIKEYTLCHGDRILIATGLSVAVEPGYEVQVRPRSGNALKRGLTVVNTPGTIDANYRGPVGIIIINTGHEPDTIRVGEKIAQLVVCPVSLSEIVEVNDLDETDRGAGGFGSTGSL